MKKIKQLSMLVIGLALACGLNSAMAVPTYETVDIVDAAGDPDRMKIIYRVGDAFAPFSGWSLLYAPALFSNLVVQSPVDGDWMASTADPDAAAGLDGIVSFLALAAMTGPNTFEVEFTWHGAGAPGSQAYELFDDAFNVVGAGRTVAFSTAISEPGTATMLVLGTLLLARHARRRPRFRHPAPA